ncbi:MAG: hypothetical protein AAGA81_14255 [Acidobacteriota bacterium]
MTDATNREFDAWADEVSRGLTEREITLEPPRAFFESESSEEPAWVADDRPSSVRRGDESGRSKRAEAGDDPVLFFAPHATSLPALITLLRLGEPFRLCRVDNAPERLAKFADLHPWSPPPLLRTAGGELGEQLAILLHLSLKGARAGFLPPAGTAERDRFFELFGFLERTVLPSLEMASEADRSPGADDLRNLAEANLLEALFRIDRQLKGRHYLLGSTYTVLDALFFALARWANRRLELKHCTPEVHKYLLRMSREREVQLALRLLGDLPLIAAPPEYLGTVDLEAFEDESAPELAVT